MTKVRSDSNGLAIPIMAPRLWANVCASIGMVILWTVCAAASDGFDWPNFRGPDHNGVSKEAAWNPAALANGAKVVWSAKVGAGYSSVAIRGAHLYTMGNNHDVDSVYCLHAADGKVVWTSTYACKAGGGNYPGPRATPTVDGDCVYTVSNDGQLRCWTAADGREKWAKNLLVDFQASNSKWGLSGSPLIVDGALIVNACEYGIAVNKQTGAKLWASPPATCGYATPVLYKKPAAAGLAVFGSKALYGVDLLTGAKLWSVKWETTYDVNAADPIVAGDKIFVSSGYDKGCALLDISGAEVKTVWSNSNMRTQFGSCVLLDGCLYGIDGSTAKPSALKCIVFATGATKWSQPSHFGSLSVANGELLILTEDGTLSIVEATPTAYQECSRAAHVIPSRAATSYSPPVAPVLCNGRIFCRNNLGDLVCIDVSK